MSKTTLIIIILTAFVVSSCVTVNIYFPASAVQKAADVIVEDIRGVDKKQNNPKEQPQKPDKESRLFEGPKKISFGPSEAFAQIDIEVTTPAIRALRESLKNRYSLLKPYYEMGVIGENNKGFIEIRDASKLNLKQKGEINRLVEQENSDRSQLYEELLKANKFGKELLPEIQSIFSNSWREKSLTNWWVEKDSGEWIRKK